MCSETADQETPQQHMNRDPTQKVSPSQRDIYIKIRLVSPEDRSPLVKLSPEDRSPMITGRDGFLYMYMNYPLFG